MQVQVHASMNPSTTSSVASLGNIGRWAVAPLHMIEVLHLFRWYTHTHTTVNFKDQLNTRTLAWRSQAAEGEVLKGLML